MSLTARLPFALCVAVFIISHQSFASCAKIKIVSGTSCDSLEVKFALKACGDRGGRAVVSCQKDETGTETGTATFKGKKAAYSAKLKEVPTGGWGKKEWAVDGEVRETHRTSQKLARAKEPSKETQQPHETHETQQTTAEQKPLTHTPSRKIAFDIDSSPSVPTVTQPQAVAVRPAKHPLVLLDQDQWKVTLSGFVELDVISDSSRSFLEAMGNGPVDSTGTVNGTNGRTQLSVRNTRLGIAVEAPPVGTWKSKGYLETDFLGFDPNSTGATASLNSEAGLFNNPTLRIRHAYIQASSGGFQLLAGQTWELFGWQPFYFMSTIQPLPFPTELLNRTAQLRASETLQFGNTATLQTAFAILRPPQRDSLYPDLQAAMRLAFNGRTSGFTGGAAGTVQTQPMSIAISGLARDFKIPANASSSSTLNFLGSAYAIDAMIPVIASSDGKSVGNTLSLQGEFTSGRGYGDQFVGWTGNLSNPLNASTVSPSKNVNLDGGIGDYDASGNFALVDLTSIDAHLQYHLPEGWNTFVNLGAGQLYSDNVNSLLPSKGLTSSGRVPYNRNTVGFANIVHCFSDQIRLGLEFSHVETSYADGSVGFDNRYQMTWLFIF